MIVDDSKRLATTRSFKERGASGSETGRGCNEKRIDSIPDAIFLGSGSEKHLLSWIRRYHVDAKLVRELWYLCIQVNIYFYTQADLHWGHKGGS